MLPLLLALAVLNAPNGPLNGYQESISVGHLAAPLGVTNWLKKSPGARRDPSLGYLTGKVIVVHAHQPPAAGESGPSPLAALLAELQEAAADRRMRVLSLVSPGSVKVFELGDQGLGHAVGEAGHDAPYQLEAGPVWLIGRAGEVRWIGSPIEEEAAFLAAVDEALRLPRGPRLRKDPAPELHAAAQAVWRADWKAALSLGKKVHSQAKKGRGPEAEALASEAEDFVIALEAHEEDLVGQADGAVRSDKGEVYWRTRLAIEYGFPRTEAARKAKLLEKEAMRSQLVLTFSDAEKYFTKVLPDRPLMFPVRASREGDKYLRKLEKLVKASDNKAGVILEAIKQIERYQEASARR